MQPAKVETHFLAPLFDPSNPVSVVLFCVGSILATSLFFMITPWRYQINEEEGLLLIDPITKALSPWRRTIPLSKIHRVERILAFRDILPVLWRIPIIMGQWRPNGMLLLLIKGFPCAVIISPDDHKMVYEKLKNCIHANKSTRETT